jgi:glycosyltransferase involved in cell wall biosynthesis
MQFTTDRFFRERRQQVGYRQASRSILITADPIGGVWHYALELCRELQKLDIEVTLATMGRYLTQVERDAVAGLENVELFESNYKLEWMDDPWHDVEEAGEWLLDLSARTRPRLIHLNQYCHGSLPWPVPCLLVGHSCVYSWYEGVKHVAPGPEWRQYKEKVRQGLLGADLVTAPSRSMLNALRRYFGEFASAEATYNGRSGAQFVPARKESLVLTAGRLWDEAKNVSILQSVAARVPWPIYAAGNCQTPDGKNTPLRDLVLLGPLDSAILGQWFSRASIFVSPARYEPFGLSALEAALSGCALVLGDIASLREIWGDAALFVPPDDADEITAVLLKLIENPLIRAQLAARARRRAGYFTPERMVKAYVQLYQNLISAQPQPIVDERAGSSPGRIAGG